MNNEELRMNNEEREGRLFRFFCDYFPFLLFNFYLLTQYLLLSKETTCFCEAYRLKNLCD